MKIVGPVVACVEQTRCLIQQTQDDLKRYRRGIEACREAIRRSNQIAEESLRKTRALKSALIVK